MADVMMVSALGAPAMFEMTFRPKPELITAVRRFIATIYSRLKLSSVLADQVMLTAHEMLENATRHSTDGLATIAMEVRGTPDAPNVTIRTVNRVRPEDRDRVAELLAELARQDDLHVFYLELMRRAALANTVGGLGLGRIASEAEMDLSMSGDGDLLELVATHRAAAAAA